MKATTVAKVLLSITLIGFSIQGILSHDWGELVFLFFGYIALGAIIYLDIQITKMDKEGKK